MPEILHAIGQTAFCARHLSLSGLCCVSTWVGGVAVRCRHHGQVLGCDGVVSIDIDQDLVSIWPALQHVHHPRGCEVTCVFAPTCVPEVKNWWISVWHVDVRGVSASPIHFGWGRSKSVRTKRIGMIPQPQTRLPATGQHQQSLLKGCVRSPLQKLQRPLVALAKANDRDDHVVAPRPAHAAVPQDRCDGVVPSPHHMHAQADLLVARHIVDDLPCRPRLLLAQLEQVLVHLWALLQVHQLRGLGLVSWRTECQVRVNNAWPILCLPVG